MLGTSLPFKYLLSGEGYELPPRDELLIRLRDAGCSSIELRSVSPSTPPTDVLAAASHVWDAGMKITLHGSVKSASSAVSDIFDSISLLLKELHRNRNELIVVIHPIAGGVGGTGDDTVAVNVEMLKALAAHISENRLRVRIALENNRRLPDGSEGDSMSLVLDAVNGTDNRAIGICFDMGHWFYRVKATGSGIPDMMPPKAFRRRIIHTHIHALDGLNTHFPLISPYELPLKRYIELMAYGYFGLYNLELDFPRFEGRCDPAKALIGSLKAIDAVLPHCARLYDDVRRNFIDRLKNACSIFGMQGSGTHMAVLQSSAYVFNTNGYGWAMDISLRSASILTNAASLLPELFAKCRLMIISHNHADHFEEITVRRLASLPMKWLIPDFMVRQAKEYGISSDRIIAARAGRALVIGPLRITPFESHHFRADTGKGVREYGYRVRAARSPSMLFPADVRDYSIRGMEQLGYTDAIVGHVWLGDGNGTADSFAPYDSDMADFLLYFDARKVILGHLYEIGREDSGMWRREHAEHVKRIIQKRSPDTEVIIPSPGEIFRV